MIRLVNLERLGERDPFLIDLERGQQVNGEGRPGREPVVEAQGQLDVATFFTAAVL